MQNPSTPLPTFGRREALASMVAALAAGVGAGRHTAAAQPEPAATLRRPARDQARQFLASLLMPRQDVDDWLAGKAFPFGDYHAELGYLHLDRDFREGVGGAVCQYRYDKLRARRTIAHADRPCRINTYGNSFTSCEQVSDGETWQEVLAAHLGEPVRNYGIGGYSVYQAYLRMRREEQQSPAEYIVFNIFDDDHYRNLHGWQRFRFGVNRKAANPTVPFVRVESDAGRFEECPNPCPTPESLYRLCDLDQAWELFRDDYVLNALVDRRIRQARGDAGVAATDFDDARYTRDAIYATQRIVDLVQEFAAASGKRVLYVLSYNPQTIRRRAERQPRFDHGLVDFLIERKLPYVDLLEAHAADYAQFAAGIDDYLARYFIGHYTPLGNFFCAFAVKDKLVELLEPKPPAYAEG